MGFRVRVYSQGLELGFRVWSLGFMVCGCIVQVLRFRAGAGNVEAIRGLGQTFLVEGEAVEVANKALGLEVLVRSLLLVAQPRKRVNHDACVRFHLT